MLVEVSHCRPRFRWLKTADRQYRLGNLLVSLSLCVSYIFYYPILHPVAFACKQSTTIFLSLHFLLFYFYLPCFLSRLPRDRGFRLLSQHLSRFSPTTHPGGTFPRIVDTAFSISRSPASFSSRVLLRFPFEPSHHLHAKQRVSRDPHASSTSSSCFFRKLI